MSDVAPKWRPRPATSLVSGFGLIGVGILLINASGSLSGFAKGLLIGMGGALVVIGAIALSPLVTQRLSPSDDQESGDWLPSREGRR